MGTPQPNPGFPAIENVGKIGVVTSEVNPGTLSDHSTRFRGHKGLGQCISKSIGFWAMPERLRKYPGLLALANSSRQSLSKTGLITLSHQSSTTLGSTSTCFATSNRTETE